MGCGGDGRGPSPSRMAGPAAEFGPPVHMVSVGDTAADLQPRQGAGLRAGAAGAGMAGRPAARCPARRGRGPKGRSGTAAMDRAALYDEDIYAWSQHQAAVLRRMAANPAALPNDLDLERVAEEIEEVGNEQRFGAESNMIQAFTYLIKLVALPDAGAARHWTKEADAFLANAERRWRPSMARAVDLDKLWRHARRRATRDLEIDGHTPPPLPKECPFGLEELVGGEADPRDLAARLVAALGQTDGI